jgi:exosortase A-associated hydrolase 1
MKYTEQALVFQCDSCRLTGVLTKPELPFDTGVIIVTGGPQYRSGSHRQFTLLARQMAASGIVSLRFDYRGMGDSEGESRNFLAVNEDIRAATDALLKHSPTIRHVAIWGLCDAASAALYYAHQDSRVNKLILLNPWVYTEAGASRARLKHYYLARLMQPSFWHKLLTGGIDMRQSAGDLSKSVPVASPDTMSDNYIARMREGLQQFKGDVLFILSGNDLIAQEFIDLTRRDKDWRTACASTRISQKTIPQANHTFSSHDWRTQVGDITIAWILTD